MGQLFAGRQRSFAGVREPSAGTAEHSTPSSVRPAGTSGASDQAADASAGRAVGPDQPAVRPDRIAPRPDQAAVHAAGAFGGADLSLCGSDQASRPPTRTSVDPSQTSPGSSGLLPVTRNPSPAQLKAREPGWPGVTKSSMVPESRIEAFSPQGSRASGQRRRGPGQSSVLGGQRQRRLTENRCWQSGRCRQTRKKYLAACLKSGHRTIFL